MKKNFKFLLILSLFVFIVGFLAAIVIGPAKISVLEILQILLNIFSFGFADELLVSAKSWQETIVYQVRLPRVITAAFVGASLAVSGAVLQSLFRNPLASPSILGVSSGASLGAVIAIFLGLAAINVWSLPLFAFIGATATLFIVYRIATYRGNTPITTLLLAGVAISAFNVSMSSLVLALALQNWEVGKSIVYWTMGGLDGRTWQHVIIIVPSFLISILIIFSYQKELDILLVGEIHASAVGVDVKKVRLILLVITAFLTAAAVSVAGGIGFIGLVVPHITRLLIGSHHRRLLPLSALLGAIIIICADLMVRGDTSNAVIPLGVITASLGAPFFLFLLLKQRKLLQI